MEKKYGSFRAGQIFTRIVLQILRVQKLPGDGWIEWGGRYTTIATKGAFFKTRCLLAVTKQRLE